MSTFEISRSVTVVADPGDIQRLLDDFREWSKWSPWEAHDPDLRREYQGAASGPGAIFVWEGNKQAGAGSMEILSSEPDLVEVRVRFDRPYKATNLARFTLEPVATGTQVTWAMAGEQRFPFSVLGKYVGLEHLVAEDFDRGLVRLKELAETHG